MQRKVARSTHSSFFVPQGSVLATLLFNLYIADLSALILSHNATLPSFADNLTLYCPHLSSNTACHIVSSALDTIRDTLAARGLSINKEKTVGMVILPSSGVNTYCLPLLYHHGEPLSMVSTTRFLGVIVDDCLLCGLPT